jgi:uncharacterized repeat protein (TIGR03803 family)
MHPLVRSSAAGALALVISAAWTAPAHAGDATVLHVFGKKRDGDSLTSRMLMDPAGVLYGTTTAGGQAGLGIVFSLTPPAPGATAWTENVVHDFAGGARDGAAPRSSLWFGSGGKLLGTTSSGGAANAGTMFQLAPPTAGAAWRETLLHSFSGPDGAFPESMPVGAAAQAAGPLFGTTIGGGPANAGVVYSLQPPATPRGAWTETVLYTFSGGADGSGPINNLVSDRAGNLYGVTGVGGAHERGTVFRLAPPAAAGGAWTQTVLHAFTGGPDGRAPDAALSIDADGVLWGTTASGGDSLLGNIFRMTPPARRGRPWTFEVLHSFQDPAGGQAPHSGLLPDGAGGFYGTTGTGGAQDCGIVYHFEPPATAGADWTLTPLYSFPGGDGGGFAYGELLLKDGALYGSTYGSDTSDSLSCNAASVAFKLTL